MYVDLLSSSNEISFNITLARVLGLSGAVYCSELLNIYKKALNKKKTVDNLFFKVDRTYISNRTTITPTEQEEFDSRWSKLGILKIHPDATNVLCLDLKLIMSIISGIEDFSSEELTTLKSKLRSKTSPEAKETKRMSQCKAIKDRINCTNNYELLTELRGWVDAIYSKPGGSLTSKAADVFQTLLMSYAKDDIQKAIRIVQIASIQGWKECQWAINSYEREMKVKRNQETFSNSRLPKPNDIKVSTVDDLDSGEQFE